MKTTGFDSKVSWIISVACGFMNFLTMMPAKLSGLLFVEIIARYKTTRELASYPLFLSMVLRCSGGPITGYLGERFGIKPVIVTGCLLSSLGVGICFFVEDIASVIVFLGLVYGFGLSFSNTLVPQVIKRYFKKNITVAIAISQAGPSLGAFVIPPVIEWIFELYGVSGTFLIMAGIILHSVPIAMLLIILQDVKEKASASVPSKENDNNKDLLPKVIKNINANDWDEPILKNGVPSIEFDEGNNIKSSDDDCVWVLQDKYKKKASIMSMKSAKLKDEKNLSNVKPAQAMHYELGEKNASFENGTIGTATIYDKDDAWMHLKQKEPAFVPVINDVRYGNFKEIHCQKLDNMEQTIEQSMKLLPESNEPLQKNNQILPSKETAHYKNQSEAKPPTTKVVSKQKAALLSLKIFLDPAFWIILITQSFQIISMVMVLTTMIDYSRDKGISRNGEVYFLMFLPLAELIGRIALAWVVDENYLTKINFTIVSFIIMASSCLFISWANAFSTMMIGLIAFGVISCGMIGVSPLMVFDYIEQKNHTMALASRYFLYGPMSFMCGPLIGYFRGQRGSYNWVYYILAIASTICGILTAFLPYFAKRRNRKKEKKRLAKESISSPDI